MMTKLSSITIYGFRGIRNKVTFDLGNVPKNLVLSAENGRGKSSLTDAVEWYFQDTISHLRKEGCFESSYRHYRLPENENATVTIGTTDVNVFGEKNLCVTRDASGSEKHKVDWQNSGSGLDSFLENAQGENVILRHAELKDFVNKTKTEKLKAVSSIIGFDVVTQTRDIINKVKGGIEKDSDYRKIQGQITEKERDIGVIISPIIGTVIDYSSAVLAVAEQLRQQLNGHIAIDNIESLNKSLEELSVLPQDERGKALQRLINIESVLSQSLVASGFVSQIQDYHQKHKTLLSKKENLERLVLMELYQAGSNILENNPNLDRCPLCESEISNQNLINNLQKKLLEFSELKIEIENVRILAEEVKQKITSVAQTLQNTLQLILSSKIKNSTTWIVSCNSVSSVLSLWIENINQSLKFANAFGVKDAELNILQEYNIETKKIATSVESEIKDLSESDSDKQRNLKLQSLKQLAEHYVRWLELKLKEKQFQRQIQALEKIVISLEQKERDEFNKALASISDEVNDFYKALHPNEGFDLLKLIPTPDRGLEFEFYFKGDRITPPNKFMSESHLNTLGLCFFLASAIEFNKNCEFIVLDDIVSSVDADHRTSFSKLLRDDPRLNQKQFIILSHDMHWSEILHTTFPTWIHKKIQAWDYDTGISIANDLELREQIQDAIQRGNPIDAARKTRDLVDITLREICEDYEINMPYRQGTGNEKRDLKSFLVATSQFFGKNNMFDSAKPPLKDIDNSLWLMNIASHPDPRKLNLNMNDVKMILSDLDKFVSFFYNHMPKCKHKKRRLEWDKKANRFLSCNICKQPI